VARINKIRVTSYRKQLRLAKQFDIKLKSSVLGSDATNFCLSQLKKRNIQPKGRRYTTGTDEKVVALVLFKQSGRAYSKLKKIKYKKSQIKLCLFFGYF
jgi:hypothetical protein